MLPTKEQFLTAKFSILRASESALLVHWTNDEFHKKSCIESLQTGAEALGYELIERVPKPTARDGGRMEMPEGAES